MDPTERDARDVMEQLSESECLSMLRTVEVGRLGVRSEDGGVDIFPVNFAVDHGTILFRTASGTKLERVIETSKVAFEADDYDWYEETAWSVVVKGDAEMVRHRPDLIELFAVDIRPWHGSRKPFFVRLDPSSITGRRFPVTKTT